MDEVIKCCIYTITLLLYTHIKLEIFTQGIFSPILKKIQTLVAELEVLTQKITLNKICDISIRHSVNTKTIMMDGQTDRPTDRQRATAIGTVDLINRNHADT